MSTTTPTECYRLSALPTPLWRAHLLPVIFGCALLTLFSKISVPLEPIPVTLQTVAVMLIGLLYTRANAIQSVATYLILGALGLPVFAALSTGLVGPSGGYLLGFMVAVAAMTFVRDKWLNKSNWLHYVALCTLGTALVFALGVAWLTRFVGFKQAIVSGVLPFILPSVIKVAILTSLLKLWRTVKPRG